MHNITCPSDFANLAVRLLSAHSIHHCSILLFQGISSILYEIALRSENVNCLPISFVLQVSFTLIPHSNQCGFFEEGAGHRELPPADGQTPRRHGRLDCNEVSATERHCTGCTVAYANNLSLAHKIKRSNFGWGIQAYIMLRPCCIPMLKACEK